MIRNSLELAALTLSLASGAASASAAPLATATASAQDTWPGSAERGQTGAVSSHITLKGNHLTVV